MPTTTIDPQLTMDRFMNASSVEDILQSLRDFYEGNISFEVTLSDHNGSSEFFVHMLHLLHSRELKMTQTPIAVNSEEEEMEIIHLILKLYQRWIIPSSKSGKECLLQPQPGRLLEALLDLGDTTNTTTTVLPPYIRVLALQVLYQLVQHHGSLAQEQWLQAPNGLHRLLEQLWVGTTNIDADGRSTTRPSTGGGDPEEAVRVHAMEVAHLLAQKSPAISKIFLFQEMESQLLDVVWNVYGGLTKGHTYVMEGLKFIYTCLSQQASEISLMELIWQRPTISLRLAQLLDLRGGYAFLHPKEYQQEQQQKKKNKQEKSNKQVSDDSSSKKTSSSSSSTDTSKLGPLSRRTIKARTAKTSAEKEDDDDNDDLDSLLQSATTTPTKKSTKTTTQEPASFVEEEDDDVVVQKTSTKQTSNNNNRNNDYPQLLESEEVVITLVLQIIDILLEPIELRTLVWTKYAPALTTFCWELALMVPPPKGAPAYFALPSSSLQERALQLIATKMASTTMMDQMNGLDRLLNVVCTGGGLATDLKERMGCSQSAIHVLRHILDPDRIHTLLLYTLAPPPSLLSQDDENDNDGGEQKREPLPPPPTVVQKLWNTVSEHLDTTTIATMTGEEKESLPDLDDDSRTIFVSGALGGLALFCVDAESREMLFQSTPPMLNTEHILEVLYQQQQQEAATDGTVSSTLSVDGIPTHEQVRTYALYRFLLLYIHETPALVQALLSSPASIHLATLVTTPSIFQPLLLLLLGLCLEFFPSALAECGGWTTNSLLDIFQGISIPKATKLMQGFLDKDGGILHNKKEKQQHRDRNLGGVFLISELESKYWRDWYQQALWTVRKRLVKELAGTGEEEPIHGGADADDEMTKEATKKIKPLQTMIAQQSTELEELRSQLEEANAKILVQEGQLEMWLRRTRSNPTQLDEMLDELTGKAASMEQEITQFQLQIKQNADEHGKELATVTAQLEEQRDEAMKLRLSSQEAQEDRDRVEQELVALSQAYSSLEEEFRRKSTTTTTTPEGGGGETTAVPAHTPSTTEVSTLRAENDRLRSSAKEADDWMASAYQRMAELVSENGNLQSQVTSLTDQLSSGSSSVQQQLEEEKKIRDEMECMSIQKKELEEQVTLLHHQLQDKDYGLSSLQEQLQQAVVSHDQWQEAYYALEQAKAELEQQLQERPAIDPNLVSRIEESEHEEKKIRDEMEFMSIQKKELEEQVTLLQEQLQEKDYNVSSLQEQLQQAAVSHDQWQEAYHALEQAKVDLEQQLQERPAVDPNLTSSRIEELEGEIETKAREILHLQTALESSTKSDGLNIEMQSRLDAARKEIESIHTRSEEAIYQKESVIRELESRLSQGLGTYTIDDIRSRDEEIDELRAANEAAQDWMGKAVEQHRILQEKLMLASGVYGSPAPPVDNSSGEVMELKKAITIAEDRHAETKRLMESIQNELKDIQQARDALRTELSLASDKSRGQVSEFENRIVDLELQLAQQQVKERAAIAQWQENHTSALMECSRLEQELERLTIERDTMASAVSPPPPPPIAIQQRGVSSSSVLSSVADFFSNDNLGSDTPDVTTTGLMNNEEMNKVQEELIEARNALNEKEDAMRTLEDRLVELQTEISVLQSRAQEQEEEAEKTLSQWQNAHAEIERRYFELENEIRDLKTTDQTDQVLPLVPPCDEEKDAEISALRLELDAAKNALESDRQVVSQWEVRVEELEVTVSSMSNRIEEEKRQADEQQQEAEKAITQWQDAHTEIEKRCLELESEIQILKTNQTDEVVPPAPHDEEKDAEMTALRLDLEAANEALEADQEVVRQWELRVEELEITLSSMSNRIEEDQRQAHEQQEEAEKAITQWQDAHAEIEQRYFELECEIQVLKNQADQVVATPPHDEEKDAKISALRVDLDAANNALESDQEVVRQWELRVEELEVTLSSMSNRIEEDQRQAHEQQEEAEKAITQWQDAHAEIEQRCFELECEIQVLKNQADQIPPPPHDEAKHAEISALRRDLDAANNAVESDQQVAHQWKLRVEELEATLSSVSRQFEAGTVSVFWEAKCSDLEQRTESLRNELDACRDEYSAVVAQWSDRVNDLEGQVMEMQSILEKQETEAIQAIQAWEGKAAELEDDLTASIAERSLLQTNAEELEMELGSERDRNEEARDETETLKMELQGARTLVEQLTEKITTEEESLVEAKGEINALTKALEESRTESELVIEQWRQRVEELDSQTESLQALLSQQEIEANEAIALWESKACELEAELAEHSLTKIEELQEMLHFERRQHGAAKIEIDTLSQDLRLVSEDSKAVVGQWSHRVDMLENRVFELESTLTQQESEANDIIATWEEKHNALQKDLTTVEGERNHQSERRVDLEATLVDLQARHETLVESEQDLCGKHALIQAELTEVQADRDRMKEQLASKSIEKLEEERDRLTIVISQMEEELVEANAMILRHVTDESSRRAAEGAAHALRGEIESLKREIYDLNSVAEDERYRRELAEEEIERLRDDVVAILSLTENEHPGEDFQQRTTKAVERLKTKERIEIDQLRKALYRSIEEVETARAGEKELGERLSKLRLQTAVGEQEIISAKSEIRFLAESLEDLRSNEEEKRASLEYRIGFLEDENDMLRRYHSSELETVRNELAQIGMEKDRILHQLKESEKTNASLVLASSAKADHNIDDPDNMESSVVTENARLRIENAHLLTVAADDKARAERRLREVLEAHRATAEADTILEQELRIAAERTIQSLKAQLEENRGSGGRHRSSGTVARDEINKGKAEERVGLLATELDLLRQDLQNVKKENSELKAKMLQAARNAKDEITTLTEECRLAQVKAAHMVREDRYEASIQLEVSKSRMSPEKGGVYRASGGLEEKEEIDCPATLRIQPTLLGAESYDLIHKQHEDMEEERRMYREFLADHDNLLALLAQNDIERDYLKKALVEAAGSVVLDRVLEEVESMTMREYGNVIKTASWDDEVDLAL